MATTLWTDLIDPVEATGIARAEQDLIEQEKGGSLARYLPNIFVDSDYVEFEQGTYGLVDEARYRAFNAPPEIGKGKPISRAFVKLPAISRNEPIDEQTQKDLARLSDDQIRKSVTRTIQRTVRSISARQEHSRAILIETGKLIVDTDNYLLSDDPVRNAGLTVTAPTLWTTLSADRLTQLNTFQTTYQSLNNGQSPGRMLMSRTAYNLLLGGTQFSTLLGNGATRPALPAEVESFVAAQGLPPIEIYDRSISVDGVVTRLLSANKVFFLPDPTDPNDPNGSLLGATYWGRTVSASFPTWGIEPGEQPGIVCGVFREESVGSSIEVQGDSIGEPVAWNANASMTITVS